MLVDLLCSVAYSMCMGLLVDAVCGFGYIRVLRLCSCHDFLFLVLVLGVSLLD